jgi:hypothetical protein
MSLEENKNACKTAGENIPARHQAPALGPHRVAPELLSQLPGINSPSQLRSVICPTRVFGPESRSDSDFGLPSALRAAGNPSENSMPLQDTDEMLWFAGRCWRFPGAQISAESQFEWKNGRLAPDSRIFGF